MDAIEEYFQGEYIQEKNKIKEIDELVNEVIKSLTDCTSDNVNGWPYELSSNKGFNSDHKYSFSTNAMIVFVLAKLKGEIDKQSPLLPETEWELHEKLKKQINDIKLIDYCKIFNDNSKNLLTIYLNDQGNIADDLVSTSGSFGFNDPFTLSWIVELFSKSTNPLGNIFQDIQSVTISKSKSIVKESFDNPDTPILKFGSYKKKEEVEEKNKRNASNHIFPLLRVIHLYKSLCNLKQIEEKDYAISKILTNLQNRINQQISHYTIQNSLFDTAELVMSLEGMLLLDDKRRIDENLVNKVFDILESNQKNNLNWRPLKPFVTSPQGDVLLPLSIEIANSLLRICKHLERSKQYYFHNYADIFNKYTKWLLANVSQCTIKNTTYKGWRSEHVQETDIIHPWETAQVLIYLMTYKTMIQERIAHKSLKKSALSFKKIPLEESWIDYWGTDIDIDFGYINCYKDIYEKFIKPRNELKDVKPLFSMLVFGPPGTGKSSIAEQLAANLNWKLITITPSDFISHGEADIESKAKSIFKTLEEQQECVILFDEIDRLILDRDSSYYSNQGDFYQFMTPSMLVKLKDLRTKKKCIFVVATNYEERIDSAIKRQGRIDEQYLVNTLCLAQRKSKIKQFEESLHTEKIDEIAKLTSLYTYTELKSLIKKNDFKNTATEKIKNTIKQPTVKLLNYKRRFQIEENAHEGNMFYEKSVIFPYNEFLALLHLKIECGVEFDKDENLLIKEVVNLPGFKLENHFPIGSNIYKQLNPLCDGFKEKSKEDNS